MRHPSQSPPPSSFGPEPSPALLASLPNDGEDTDLSLGGGVAPWADVDPATGFARVHDLSQVPMFDGDILGGGGVDGGLPLPLPRRGGCSPLVVGGGVFGQGMYNADWLLRSEVPARVLRLAFRYGLNALDTSPYYYPSESVIGRALRILAPEWPRSAYYVCTKAGRYGPDVADFDYSPEKVRASVEASIRRLGCGYLDVVYLHDAEFVAEKVGAGQDEGFAAARVVRAGGEGEGEGDDAAAHAAHLRSLGLAPGQEPTIHGEGDERLLAAVRTLFSLKDEGKVRHVGISGYPLPALLRLSRLVAATPPYRPLDVVLSYSNHTLHSDLLPLYLPLFATEPTTYAPSGQRPPTATATATAAWRPPTILNASPFSMGLLTPGGPPAWHPAPTSLKDACAAASRDLQQSGEGPDLAEVALTFGIRGAELGGDGAGERGGDPGPGPRLRTLLGMSSPSHVHTALRAYRVLLAGRARARAAGEGEGSAAAAGQGAGEGRSSGGAAEAAGQGAAGKSASEGAAAAAAASDPYAALSSQQQRAESLVLSRVDEARAQGWSWASPAAGA